MDKYVAYGDWFTTETCSKCQEHVSYSDIYERKCCRRCGQSNPICLDYDLTTLRRAFTKKTWIPFMSEWVYEVKDRKPRFYGNPSGSGFTRSTSLSLLTTAAVVSIM